MTEAASTGRVVIGTASGGRLITIDGAGQPADAHKVGKRICSDMISPADDWIVVGTAGAIVACRLTWGLPKIVMFYGPKSQESLPYTLRQRMLHAA